MQQGRRWTCGAPDRARQDAATGQEQEQGGEEGQEEEECWRHGQWQELEEGREEGQGLLMTQAAAWRAMLRCWMCMSY